MYGVGNKRNASGEGTIWYDSKTKRWRARITIPTPTSPKTRTVSAKSQKEMLRKKAEAISERDSGLVFDAENLTLAEYLTRWLASAAKKNIRPSSYARYEQLSRVHIIPALGHMKLKTLSALHLEAFYEAKLEERSPRTVNYMHVTISKALDYAVRKDLLRKNVAASAEAPQPDAPEIQPLNESEVGKLLEAATDRLRALYSLAVGTGMRRSEILGLREADVDIDAGTLQVLRGLTTAPGGGFLIQPTKRKSSQRLLELPGEVVSDLQLHRTRKKEERLAAGPRWEDSGHVFTTVYGTPVHPNTLYRNYFFPLREKAGLPDLHFHDLRHTYASLALKHGIPLKVVAGNLGHGDVATTMRTYAHVMPGMGRDAAGVMNSVLFGGKST